MLSIVAELDGKTYTISFLTPVQTSAPSHINGRVKPECDFERRVDNSAAVCVWLAFTTLTSTTPTPLASSKQRALTINDMTLEEYGSVIIGEDNIVRSYAGEWNCLHHVIALLTHSSKLTVPSSTLLPSQWLSLTSCSMTSRRKSTQRRNISTNGSPACPSRKTIRSSTHQPSAVPPSTTVKYTGARISSPTHHVRPMSTLRTGMYNIRTKYAGPSSIARTRTPASRICIVYDSMSTLLPLLQSSIHEVKKFLFVSTLINLSFISAAKRIRQPSTKLIQDTMVSFVLPWLAVLWRDAKFRILIFGAQIWDCWLR